MIRIRPGILALAAAAAFATLPASLTAQDPAAAPPAAPELSAEASEWLQEIQQIHSRLSELQERALADPELSAHRDSLGSHIKIAMDSIDPSLAQRMGRIEEMEQLAAAAAAQSDDAKLTELRTEAQQIEEQFFTVRQQALQQPALAAEISAFQTMLEQRILATDPEAPKLLARFQELEAKLAGLAQGPQ